VRAACDELVSVPVRGRIGSLNVSAAAAVLLFEAARVRAMQHAPGLDKST
jgi:23S rRNA (guanosine2251-2'-O)-methyltransferase